MTANPKATPTPQAQAGDCPCNWTHHENPLCAQHEPPQAPARDAGAVAWWAAGYTSMTFFALFFAAGALVQEYPILRGWRAAGLSISLGVCALFLLHDPLLAMALTVPVVTLWIGRQSWPGLHSAGRFGDLSYGVYIYAWPMQQAVVALMPQGASYYALLAVNLAVILPLAWLSWRYVEAPALRRKPASDRAGELIEPIVRGRVGAHPAQAGR